MSYLFFEPEILWLEGKVGYCGGSWRHPKTIHPLYSLNTTLHKTPGGARHQKTVKTGSLLLSFMGSRAVAYNELSWNSKEMTREGAMSPAFAQSTYQLLKTFPRRLRGRVLPRWQLSGLWKDDSEKTAFRLQGAVCRKALECEVWLSNDQGIKVVGWEGWPWVLLKKLAWFRSKMSLRVSCVWKMAG